MYPLTNDAPIVYSIGNDNLPKDTKMKEIEMIKKPFYSTAEIADALGVTVSTIRMAKMNNQIVPDETMSTSRHTWYTAKAVQDYAKEKGFNIIFTIAS